MQADILETELVRTVEENKEAYEEEIVSAGAAGLRVVLQSIANPPKTEADSFETKDSVNRPNKSVSAELPHDPTFPMQADILETELVRTVEENKEAYEEEIVSAGAAGLRVVLQSIANPPKTTADSFETKDSGNGPNKSVSAELPHDPAFPMKADIIETEMVRTVEENKDTYEEEIVSAGAAGLRVDLQIQTI